MFTWFVILFVIFLISFITKAIAKNKK